MLADSAGGAWTFGGSILTFAFPMILFIVVAGALYVLYTKPEFVPGHPAPDLERPVSYTPVPGKPTAAGEAPAVAETTGMSGTTVATTGTTVAGTTAGETNAAADAETAGTTAGEAAETEDAE
jgi:hypothetical protein